ncbi:MAG: arginine--tRNA ligase [Myxococcota bacterium]
MIHCWLQKYLHEIIDKLYPGSRQRLAQKQSTFSRQEKALWAANIQQPKFSDHGDYATNAALELAAVLHQPPRDIAHAIAQVLKQHDASIANVAVAGAGFVNIHITPILLSKGACQALQQEHNFGRGPQNTCNVLLEFVSTNPTGPLHLGHARGAFVGDALARLLDFAGYNVSREYYINDTGGQIEQLARSIYAHYCQALHRPLPDPSQAYNGPDIQKLGGDIATREGTQWLNKESSEWLQLFGQWGVKHSLASIQNTLRKANIPFDRWFSERSLHENGSLQRALEVYRQKGLLYEAQTTRQANSKKRREDSKAAQHAQQQQGGTFLQTSSFGDEEDRIVLRADGSPAYFLADLAYHADKFARGFHRLINVFGADHVGHVNRLKAGLAAMGLPQQALQCVLVHMVRLVRQGQQARFSKREGNVYLLDDLLDDIGIDAARFAFLMRTPESPFDLDVDLLCQQAMDNPVFYVQYGHARMATLLQRAEQEGLQIDDLHQLSAEVWLKLALPEERELLKAALALPHVIQQAAAATRPHRVLHYAYGLVEQFHSYFTKYRSSERILSEDRELSQARVALVRVVKLALSNSLGMLGIHAPAHMLPKT